jgi:hypothetical protein
MKSKIKFFIRILFMLLALVCGAPAQSEVMPPPGGIMIPLYAYPTWWNSKAYVWDDVAAVSNVNIIAIINPDNGPRPTKPNADFKKGMAQLKLGKVLTAGYVYTSYGKRSISAVKADVQYYTNYGVDGIFLDEAANKLSSLAYYSNVYTFAKSRGMKFVIINPGTHMPEQFLTVCDIAVIYEDPAISWNAYIVASYVKRYACGRFAAMLHSDRSLFYAYIAKTRAANIGWLYVTDDRMPDPWDTIPTYWRSFVRAVGGY